MIRARRSGRHQNFTDFVADVAEVLKGGLKWLYSAASEQCTHPRACFYFRNESRISRSSTTSSGMAVTATTGLRSRFTIRTI